MTLCHFRHRLEMCPQSKKNLVWPSTGKRSISFLSSVQARVEAGMHLAELQRGEVLDSPPSQSIPHLKVGCHALHIQDEDKHWYIIHFIDDGFIVILNVFKSEEEIRVIPDREIKVSRKNLTEYLNAIG